jgi:hypothetical protein
LPRSFVDTEDGLCFRVAAPLIVGNIVSKLEGLPDQLDMII